MVLYLIRHGESTDNILGRYTGQADPPLSPIGRIQAARLGAALTGIPLAAVYASDLRRAAATARAIARAHGLPVRRRAALREVDMGAWTGMTYPELAAGWPEHLAAWLARPAAVAPPGGETLAQVRRRALFAISRIRHAHGTAGGDVAVISHGGPLRALLSGWTGAAFHGVTLPPGACWRVTLLPARPLTAPAASVMMHVV